MFDSENISLVTTVEAGEGVTITFGQNSEGFSQYTAAVDQTWLNTKVDARYAALAADYIGRLEALEKILSVTTTTSGGTVTPVSNQIVVGGATAGLFPSGGTVALTWNIVGVDGTNIVTRTYTQVIPANASLNHVASGLATSIKNSPAALKYLTSVAADGSGNIDYAWIQASAGFTISITNVSGPATFTVN